MDDDKATVLDELFGDEDKEVSFVSSDDDGTKGSFLKQPLLKDLEDAEESESEDDFEERASDMEYDEQEFKEKVVGRNSKNQKSRRTTKNSLKTEKDKDKIPAAHDEELNGPTSEYGPDDKILEARRDFEEALSKLKGPRRRREADSEAVDFDDVALAFTNRMLEALRKDDEAVVAKKPALAKLKMLDEVSEMLTKKHMQEVLLDNQVLDVMKKWLEPNIRGHLAVSTVRKRLLELLFVLPVETVHLRESGIGKIVMFYYQKRTESLEIRKLAGDLIAIWSRPILGSSLDYREMIRSQQQRGEEEEDVDKSSGGLRRLQSDKFKKMVRSGVLERVGSGSGNTADSRFHRLKATMNRQKSKKP